MISLDEIALWYLIIFSLYLGSTALHNNSVNYRMPTILAGICSIIIIVYYLKNKYNYEGYRVSMPEIRAQIPVADNIDIHNGIMEADITDHIPEANVESFSANRRVY